MLDDFELTFTESREKPTIPLRLVSMFLDHFFTTFILTVSCGIILIPMFIFYHDTSSDKLSEIEIPMVITSLLFLIAFSFYFNKDIFNGRSIAKRILKLQIVDFKTREVASPVKCFIRNISLLIWPVEVVVTLFSPQRRIGDYMAGTQVEFYNINRKQNSITRKDYFSAIAFSFLYTLGFTGFIFLLFFLQILSLW